MLFFIITKNVESLNGHNDAHIPEHIVCHRLLKSTLFRGMETIQAAESENYNLCNSGIGIYCCLSFGPCHHLQLYLFIPSIHGLHGSCCCPQDYVSPCGWPVKLQSGAAHKTL